MKSLRYLSRIVAGLVFIFSGITKGVDPLGSMYKFIDYFTAFGMDSINNLAFFLGVLLCLAEFLIGFAVLAGIRIKEASWGMLLFMIGFTPLTLILAINNPVSDCGCFGDAIHMTNWQTFFKNVIILIFVIIVFAERKNFRIVSSIKTEYIALTGIGLAFLIFVQLNYRYLPFIDFRPYSIGTDIMQDMTIPDDAQLDEYEVLLLYEKDGIIEEFTLENYPSDTSWVFVDQKSTLIKKGYEAPIHDFSLNNIYGEDLTHIILTNPGYTLLMVSTRLGEAYPGSIENGITIGSAAKDSGFDFFILTSSSNDELIAYDNDELFLSGDETTLKTIIRSNPGYLLIGNGVIIKKWSHRSMTGFDTIIEKLDMYEKRKDANPDLRLILLMAMVVAITYATTKLIEKK